jgi:hypothetical protein
VPRYDETSLRAAVAASSSMSDVLRHFGLRPAGGNHARLRHWLRAWEISTEHFTPPPRPSRERIPLADVMVERSTYHRGHLKDRLYAEGWKERCCELCGQGEEWRGRRMALILDHINGVADDHRLENLQIVCPNCAATLDTHCGRNVTSRSCAACGRTFRAEDRTQRHCSQSCGQRSDAARAAQTANRRVERPPYEQLLAEIAATSWCAVGRKYGVSDNAVRKWVRAYERERAREEPALGELGTAGVPSA